MVQKKVCKSFRARCAHDFTVLNSFYLFRVFWVISLDLDEVEESDPREQNGSDLKDTTGDGADSGSTKKKRKSKKKKDATVTLDDTATEKDPEDDDTSSKVEANAMMPENRMLPVPRVRPNPIYRYLLGFGRVGQILVMEFILADEWIQTYLPALAALLNVITLQVFPSSRRLEYEDTAVSQTTGFVSNDGSIVRGGRKRKAQTQKDDQKALNQLMQIGDVSQARYRFLSQSFMERHGLGAYASESPEEAEMQSRIHRKKKNIVEDGEESDAEWIVEALTQDEPPSGRNGLVDTSVGVSVGSNGPALSVGMEFSFGEGRRKKKRSSLSEVARQTSTSRETKNHSRPRVSDRESGVMGRIRAAGANSLVGRSLLGAYPGDAPPPSEAASSAGLVDFATKYGYGEWSDDDSDEAGPRKKRRRETRSTGPSTKQGKGRKREPAQIGLDFDLSPRSSREIPRAAARASLLRQGSVVGSAMEEVRKRGHSSENTESRRRKVRRKKVDKLVKPAMERLREVETKKVVKPAMDILKQKAREGKSNED
jgi:hypothetical protein